MTGRFLGGVGLDGINFGMRVRRAHESDMRHARQRDIADVEAAALREAR
jgi:hypothetical protein